jgi:rhodanese-related sulfurtransferase
MALMDELPRDLRIVLYDQDGSMSSQVAADLIRAGYSNVQVLMGGFDEWTREYGERLVTTIPFYLGLPPG